MPSPPLSARALLGRALKLARRAVEKPKSIEIKATANAEEDRGVSRASLLQSLTSISDARKERRKAVGARINMEIIDKAISAARTGYMGPLTDLSRETIDVDPHLGSVLQKRFGAVAGLPWEVQVAEGPGVDRDKALFYAMVVRDQLRKLPNFRQNLLQLAWGLFDGRAALELKWKDATKPVIDPRFGKVSLVLGSMAWIHPRRLSFGPKRQLILTDETARASSNYGAVGFDLSEDGLRDANLWRKFCSFTPQLFGEYPEKEGLAPRCLNWSFFKRFTARDMMTLIELFGKPWRVVKVPEESSANTEDIKASLKTVDALGGAYTALLAKGTDIEVIQPGRTAGQIHKEIVAEVDNQISKLVLGQKGTTDGVEAGMNSPQANVMQAEQNLILKLDADSLSEIGERQITDPIVEVNYGAAELVHAPKFVLRSDRPVDRSTEIQRLDSALKAGLEIKKTEAYECSGFQMPDQSDAIIKIEQPRPVEPGVQPPQPRAMIIDPNEPSPTSEEQSVPDDELDNELTEVAARLIDQRLFSAIRSKTSRLVATTLCNAIAAIELSGNDPDISDLAEQPETDFGSPDDFISENRKKMFGHAGKWAADISSAIDDETRPKSIIKKVKSAVDNLDLDSYTNDLARRSLHSAALGALDSALQIGDIDADDVEATSKDRNIVSLSFATSPFKSAMESFIDRDILPKEQWKTMEDTVKRQSFTIAGVETKRMRDKIFTVLASEIEAGADLRGFKKTMLASLRDAGMIPSKTKTGALSASHIETVFRTNVLNAYNYGRKEHSKQDAVTERFPVWEIRAVRDSRTRKTHKDAHGLKLLHDDPFWEKAYPPFGFNCRCRVVPRGKKYLPDVIEGSLISGLPDEGFVSGYARRGSK